MRPTRPIPALIVASILAALTPAQAQTPITLDQAMANPDWIGTPVEAAWWGWDSRQVYFKQKRLASPLRDTFLAGASAAAPAKLVADSQLAGLDSPNPVYNRERSRAILQRN